MHGLDKVQLESLRSWARSASDCQSYVLPGDEVAEGKPWDNPHYISVATVSEHTLEITYSAGDDRTVAELTDWDRLSINRHPWGAILRCSGVMQWVTEQNLPPRGVSRLMSLVFVSRRKPAPTTLQRTLTEFAVLLPAYDLHWDVLNDSTSDSAVVPKVVGYSQQSDHTHQSGRTAASIVVGAMLIALAPASPALTQVFTLTDANWFQLTAARVVYVTLLLAAGIIAIGVPFVRRRPNRVMLAIAAMAVGGIAAFYPCVPQLMSGPSEVAGRLESSTSDPVAGSLEIDPINGKVSHSRPLRVTTLDVKTMSDKSRQLRLVNADALRVCEFAVGDNLVRIRWLPYLQRIISIEPIEPS